MRIVTSPRTDLVKVFVLLGDVLFGIWTSGHALNVNSLPENQRQSSIQSMSIIAFVIILFCILMATFRCTLGLICLKCYGEGTYSVKDFIYDSVIIFASITYFVVDNIPQLITSNSQDLAVPTPYILVFIFLVYRLHSNLRLLECFKCCKEEPLPKKCFAYCKTKMSDKCDSPTASKNNCCCCDCCKKRICWCFNNCLKNNKESKGSSAKVDNFYEAFSTITFFVDVDALFTAAERAGYNGPANDYECITSSHARVVFAWVFLCFSLVAYILYFIKFTKCSDKSSKYSYGKIALLFFLVPALLLYLIADNEELIRCSQIDNPLTTRAQLEIKLILYCLSFVIIIVSSIAFGIFYVIKHFR